MPHALAHVFRLMLGGCLAALVSCATPEEKSVPVADDRLNLKGPTLVAFFAAGGAPEARRALEDALSRTAACLQDGGVRTKSQIVEKDWMKVKDGEKDLPLYPPFANTTGVYLLTPGRAPRYVDAVAGTDTLRTTLPNAAAQYFSVGGCARKTS